MKQLKLTYNGTSRVIGEKAGFCSLVNAYMAVNSIIISFALGHRIQKTNSIALAGNITTCKDSLGTYIIQASKRGSNDKKLHGSSLNKSILIFVDYTPPSQDNKYKVFDSYIAKVFEGIAFLNKVEDRLGIARSSLYTVDYNPYLNTYNQNLPSYPTHKLKMFCVTLNRKWTKSIPAFHLAIMFIRMGNIKGISKLPIEKALIHRAESAGFTNHLNDMTFLRNRVKDILFFIDNLDKLNTGLAKSETSGSAGIIKLFNNHGHTPTVTLSKIRKRIKTLKQANGKNTNT